MSLHDYKLNGPLSATIRQCVFTVTALLTMSSTAMAGQLYVSVGFFSGKILSFTPTGSQSTFATGLVLPYGLALDAAGNLFESDNSSNNRGAGRILKFTPSGSPSLFASGLNSPDGLAFDASSNLFEADYNAFGGPYVINEFAPTGAKSVFATGLSFPVALAFDSSGNLFETDAGSGKIYEITPAGVRSTFASNLNPVGLAFDSSGNLYESDRGANAIFKFAPNGTRSTFASGLNFPYGLAFDSGGNLYESDGYGGEFGTPTGHIYEFTPAGVRSTFASGLLDPTFIAIAVPEPSTAVLLAISCLLTVGFVFAKRCAKD